METGNSGVRLPAHLTQEQAAGVEPQTPKLETPHIGSLNEKPLHASLKDWYARPGDLVEVPVDGYLVDIVRNDLLIEIQTGGFSGIRTKVLDLVERYALRLVFPIAQQKWIVKQPHVGKDTPARRRSPRRGAWVDVFSELVAFPQLLARHEFAIEVVLILEEEVRRFDARRAWRRRGWVTHERRLLDVVDHRIFETPDDLASLLPEGLPKPFTTADLSGALACPRRLAQRMAYCLREMGAIVQAGKAGNAILYEER